jgi:hypothetical protein
MHDGDIVGVLGDIGEDTETQAALPVPGERKWGAHQLVSFSSSATSAGGGLPSSREFGFRQANQHGSARRA